MKSIKNQYIALKEGKMTEAQFMRNVRMTLPEYISNVTLFKQAEKILMNKGIISEIKIKEAGGHANFGSIAFSGTKPEKEEPKEGEVQLKTLNPDDKFIFPGHDKVQYKVKTVYKDGTVTVGYPDGGGHMEYNGNKFVKPLNEAKDTSATGYYNQDGKEQYSKFDELDNLNAHEVFIGLRCEMTHEENKGKSKKDLVKLVIKNLTKDQFYYTHYNLTGVAGLKPTEFTTTKRKSFFDQMEEVDKNGSNLVDEKNKMVIVKEGLNEVSTDDIFSKWRELSNDEKEHIAKFIKTTGDRDAKKQAEKVASQSKPKNLNEVGNDLVAIADDIYNELQSLGSYDDTDVSKLLNTYPNLSPEEEKEIEVIIFDRDREELMREADADQSDDELEAEYDEFQKDIDRHEPVDEARKAKLKNLVKKMMQEMFDGRDNVTDVTGENV